MLSLSKLMQMPWTIRGPEKIDEDGESHWQITIAELPEFFVAGSSRDDVLGEYGAALKAFLRSYVDRGEMPPLPAQQALWQVFAPKPARRPAQPMGLISQAQGSTASPRVSATLQALDLAPMV